MATKTSSCSSSLSLFCSPLTIEQLIDVLNLLKRCGFPQRRWKELGLTLGLLKNTLDAIERNHPGDVSGCLTECLSQWLSRADNVDSKGRATFDSLSDALKSMNENAAADKLDQEKRNAMISGNDIKGTNDVYSTATGTNKPLIGGPPLSPIALMDISDDIPKVSELIEFHELLIKGQLEESLPLLDADSIRKIRNAVNDHEGLSLLRQAFEEHPTLLHEMRVATGKIKAVHVTVEIPSVLTSYDRANKIFSSVLATLKCHPNPNSVFSSLITSLQKVGLRNMASKLMENLKMKGGHVDPNLEQQPSVSKEPLQPVDVTAQSHTPQPTITGSQSSTPTTVIELSSKSEVAANIKSLHSRFASLDSNIRDEFEELVKRGQLNLKAVARSAATYLSIKVSSLKHDDVDELFDSLQPHYDFFSCGGVLQHLANKYLSTAQIELTQYIDSVDKFSESSQLKHIRSTIKEKLSSLPAAASPTTSDQTKPVVIKLNDRWEEMTISKLKAVLKHYFGVTSDLFSHISFDYGSFVITLLIPTSLSQSLIDAINNKTNSMSRLGILEVAVDNKVIPIRRKDDNNFDVSLHESVKACEFFEVSMLLQLGADPNSKDERGKSAVEIAKERKFTQLKEILLPGGGEETGEVEWIGYGSVTLTKPSAGQCQEVISQLTDSHQNIGLYYSSPDIVYLLMSLVLDIKTIKGIDINNTKITKDVILLLSHKITNNTSLETLWIRYDSINDDGVIALTQSLINNKTITTLYLHNNPDITSTSAQSLAELLLYNHTLYYLNLYRTNIDTDGVLVLMESLRTNNTLMELTLDNKHEQTCYSLPYYKTIENRLYFW
uniref:Death domain-containing protein n=1 Tax=Amphimedon queenslandica TaxID=400682 RepID=A0A1X7T9S3_AMPQE